MKSVLICEGEMVSEKELQELEGVRKLTIYMIPGHHAVAIFSGELWGAHNIRLLRKEIHRTFRLYQMKVRGAQPKPVEATTVQPRSFVEQGQKGEEK